MGNTSTSVLNASILRGDGQYLSFELGYKMRSTSVSNLGTPSSIIKGVLKLYV